MKATKQNLELLIIGGGKMGYALAKGVLAKKIFNPQNLGIIEPNLNTRNFLTKNLKCNVFDTNEKTPKTKNFIIAVKPNLASSILKPYQNLSDSLFISIMAGITTQKLKNMLNVNRIVRVMPNTPCMLGYGMSVYFSLTKSDEDDKLVSLILNSVGKSLKVTDEKKIDAATAISGSGPGFMFFYALNFFNRALEFGFNEDEANLLVRQNFLGSAKMMDNFYDKPIKSFMEDVATPNGTTAAGIDKFKSAKFEKVIQESLEACYQKSLEIGQKF